MKKVSFDFDQTLDRKEIQSYAKYLVDNGFEVHIVTARYDSIDKYTEDFCNRYNIKRLKKDHNYLFEVADKLGISRDNIHFMNMNMKYGFFKNENFIWHLDDDADELNTINKNTDTIAVNSLLKESDWKSKCNKLLDEKTD